MKDDDGVMVHKHIHARGCVLPLVFLLTVCWLVLGQDSGRAQTASLNVTNFGARGDAVSFLASTVFNSKLVTVQSTNRLSGADVGKVIELFGAGPATTASNSQDLVSYIMSVSNGTNITISNACGTTAANLAGIYGTQNAGPFQSAVNAAAGGPTMTTINIPAGNYLMTCPQVLDTNFTMPNEFSTYPAVSISKGGIDFVGAGQGATILSSCGAWQVKGSWVLRGSLFFCQGPVTNDAPLTFERMTIDGGNRLIDKGSYWPASLTDGSGWDVSHHAVLDIGVPLHLYKAFINVTFQNWGGETLEGAPWTNGFVLVTNCSFLNGNGTALGSFAMTHTVENSLFSNIQECAEFYEGYCNGNCLFQNNFVTNIPGGLFAINGAQSNRIQPSYTIQGNTFYLRNNENGIQTSPAQNLYILNNKFIGDGSGQAVALGTAGYQGTGLNTNILIEGNLFSNVFNAIDVEGTGQDSVVGLTVVSNIGVYSLGGNPGFAYGYGWGSNMVFTYNITTGLGFGLNSTLFTGQYYADDISNQFPPNNNYDNTGKVTEISYNTGLRQVITSELANSVFYIDDAAANQIPPGATITVDNAGTFTTPVYASASRSGSPVSLTNANTVTFAWMNNSWQPTTLTNASMATFVWTNGVWAPVSELAQLVPPTNLHVLPWTNGP